jgi:hypothetical protein
MDIASPEDSTLMDVDDHRTPHPASRGTLLDRLSRNADHPGHNPTITTQTDNLGSSESTPTSPPPAPSFNTPLPLPESRLSSDFRRPSVAADVPRADASSRASAAPETHAHEPPDPDMIDLYAHLDSPSQSPLSLFSDLSEAVRESDELERITSLHRQLTAEREELLARHEETTRALSRTKTQLDRVLLLADEATRITAVFVEKEKTRLDIKKMKAEARIERRKNLEAERRKAKELERIRQHEEERKARLEIEQQAERQRLEEQRKEEALAAERKRQEEIRAQERAQAEERRQLEEEEQQRLAEEDRRRRDDEERKRLAEAQRKEEEEQLRKRQAEREALARKQEEDRRNQLLERRRLAEEERKRKELEAAAAKAEAEKQAAEQRIFQERRATVLKDKFKNYGRPESGVPLTGSPPTLEGTSNLPSIAVNDVPANTHPVTEQYPGIAKIYRPRFVPATTEAGRLPPDLSQQLKVSDSLINHAVKHETASPVITPIDNDQPIEDTPPTQLPSRSVPSISTSAPSPASAPLPAPPHLPAKPVTVCPQPHVPLQQSGRSPRRYPPRRSRSRSRSLSHSPRRGSSSPRIPSRSSRSPDTTRGRYRSPPERRMDHYSPPRQSYRGGGSRYDRDSRSDSPPPPPPNSRKRVLQVPEDSWTRASTPSKLDYSHPAKRRAVSPLRSRSPPSPPPPPPTHPPHVATSRRLPPSSRRGRGPVPPSHVPLEQRLSTGRQLSERIQ